MKVVGIDLSLTATGIATIEAFDAGMSMLDPEVRLIKSKPDGDTLHSRFIRLEAIAATVVAHCRDADLVVIEGPSYGSRHGSAWDRAGLWWWVVSILNTLGTPVAEVPPTVRAKWATNKGTATKTAVAVAINKLWPEVATSDDNECDALCLATIGAQRMGMPVPHRAHHNDAVKKVVWPNELDS